MYRVRERIKRKRERIPVEELRGFGSGETIRGSTTFYEARARIKACNEEELRRDYL